MNYGTSRTPRRPAVVLALVLYTALAGVRSRADRPMVDEAWFGSPALNLVRHGSMHTSILEGEGTYWQGIDRHTFWILPVQQAAGAPAPFVPTIPPHDESAICACDS